MCSIADSFARGGYLVLMPDYFRGDPIPKNMTGFDTAGWFGRHTTAATQSIIDSTMKYARDTLKVKKVGVVGYCFGGPFVVRQLAPGKGVDAGFTAHPGPFTDAEVNAIAAPLSIAAAG
jgi:dienelactone hydrolase